VSNKKFFALIVILSFVSFSICASVKVTGLDLSVNEGNGFFKISTQGRSSGLPDVKVTGNVIEVTLNKAASFKSISKNAHGSELSAAVHGENAIIKAILPYEVSSNSVSLGWKNNQIEVIFPRGRATKIPLSVDAQTVSAPLISAKSKIAKESLNEEYLKDLIKENGLKVQVKSEKKDEVNLKQASSAKVDEMAAPKGSSDNFSFAGYAAKFTVFLALVLGLFYGIVQLLKKGVFSRGKLGFLNNSQIIEVLSTTYVSPKRTLMVIRAHKQIFLVANSESGFTFLSEMNDISGLLKEGEKHVTGTNFDVNLSEADLNGLEELKLKDNIMESASPPETGFAKLSSAKDDIVKFSDELKKKAKKLKPIEFN
jgi:flagellar biogenesis protein FliO